MRILWLAIGVGFTAYCIMTNSPVWLNVLNVIIDAILILSFLKDRR